MISNKKISSVSSTQMRVFHNNDGVTHSPLWELTWNRVTQFLPTLKEELFDKEPSEIYYYNLFLLS